MSILAPIVTGVLAAVVACGAAVLLWIAYCETVRARERQRRRRTAQEHARLAGQHEQCDLTGEQELVWERYATRYAGLGQDVQKGTSA